MSKAAILKLAEAMDAVVNESPIYSTQKTAIRKMIAEAREEAEKEAAPKKPKAAKVQTAD